jgi:hypothetical protein
MPLIASARLPFTSPQKPKLHTRRFMPTGFLFDSVQQGDCVTGQLKMKYACRNFISHRFF